MRNPKDFQATPYTRFQPTDKSHTGTKELQHNGTRKEKMTSPTHYKATPADEAINAIPASTKTHPKLAVRMPMSSGYVGDGKQMATSHSKPEVPVQPKKWHRKGYSLTLPTSLDE